MITLSSHDSHILKPHTNGTTLKSDWLNPCRHNRITPSTWRPDSNPECLIVRPYKTGSRWFSAQISTQAGNSVNCAFCETLRLLNWTWLDLWMSDLRRWRRIVKDQSVWWQKQFHTHSVWLNRSVSNTYRIQCAGLPLPDFTLKLKQYFSYCSYLGLVNKLNKLVTIN